MPAVAKKIVSQSSYGQEDDCAPPIRGLLETRHNRTRASAVCVSAGVNTRTASGQNKPSSGKLGCGSCCAIAHPVHVCNWWTTNSGFKGRFGVA